MFKREETRKGGIARRAENHCSSGSQFGREHVDAAARSRDKVGKASISGNSEVTSMDNHLGADGDFWVGGFDHGSGGIDTTDELWASPDAALGSNDHGVLEVDAAPLNPDDNLAWRGRRGGQVVHDGRRVRVVRLANQKGTHESRLGGVYDEGVELKPFVAWESPLRMADMTAPQPNFAWIQAWGKSLGVLRSTGPRGAQELWRFSKGQWRRVSPSGRRVGSALYSYGGRPWTTFGKRRAVVLTTDSATALLLDRDGTVLREFPLEGEAQGFPVRWSKHEFAYIADFGQNRGRAIVVLDIDSGLTRIVWRSEELLGGLVVDVNHGHVAWHAWPSGTMPWDASVVYRADRSYLYLRPEQVAGRFGAAATDAQWLDDQLYFQIEQGDRFLPAKLQNDSIHVASAARGEGRSEWFMGWRWTDALGSGSVHVTTDQSTTSLQYWRRDGGVEQIPGAPMAIQELATVGDDLFVIGSDGVIGSGLWRYRHERHQWKKLSGSVSSALGHDSVSASELRRSDNGVPFVFYEPRNAAMVAPLTDRPGLVLDIHGGPTGYARRAMKLGIQYLTSSGFAVASVDYRGSTTYGATYRRSLNGHYGEFDVDDICDVARSLIARGEVDPRRVFVRGGSSGGMTALLCAEDPMFAGAIAHYPVTDALLLNDVTHESEGKYLEELIGPLPESLEQFKRVSPMHRTQRPQRLLVTQGDVDRVIPVELTRSYVSMLTDSGSSVTYLELANEGHGYRDPANQALVLEAELAFLRS